MRVLCALHARCFGWCGLRRRFNNVAIKLKQLRLGNEEICRRVVTCDDAWLTMDRLETLLAVKGAKLRHTRAHRHTPVNPHHDQPINIDF